MAQRHREIGVRIAIGADARSLLWLIVGEGLGLPALGLAGALAVGRVLASLLYDVSRTDPPTLAAAGGRDAGHLRPRQLGARPPALSVDPTSALRQE